MIRINELKLPLDHTVEALREAVVQRLGVPAAEVLGTTVARRGYDARRRSAIHLVYAIDADVRDEAALLARDSSLRPSPDTRYRPPMHATAPVQRPVIIGTGPCGLM